MYHTRFYKAAVFFKKDSDFTYEEYKFLIENRLINFPCNMYFNTTLNLECSNKGKNYLLEDEYEFKKGIWIGAKYFVDHRPIRQPTEICDPWTEVIDRTQ